MVLSSDPVLLIAGRLSGDKNTVAIKIIEEVASKIYLRMPALRVEVVGGPVSDIHRALEQKFPFVKFHGYQQAIGEFYKRATIVCGSGRVAMEAMAMKKPVVAIGERQYIGPVTTDNRFLACATNFGDLAYTHSYDWLAMKKDIERLLASEEERTTVASFGYELVKEEFDIEKIYPKIADVYRATILETNAHSITELPILMYHRVLSEPPAKTKYGVYVTTSELEWQLESLKRRGFTTITFDDLVSKRLPRKPIILTFDDGYEDNYLHLFPLLKKYGMKAVIYIVGDRNVRNNFWDIPAGEPEAMLMKSDQILEMERSGVVEFGAHSHAHERLIQFSEEEQRTIITSTKKELEDFLGKEIFSFAYPWGEYNAETKRAVCDAGFHFGVATDSGPVRFAADPFAIRRIQIFSTTSPAHFRRKTSGWYLRYRDWKKNMKK